jgi:hypothetical protein
VSPHAAQAIGPSGRQIGITCRRGV